MINLKLNPQKIELKKQKYRIFQSKNAYSTNARSSFNPYKHITKLRAIKSKTIYNMTHILKNKSRYNYIFTYYINYYHQTHLCLKYNISRSALLDLKQ